MVMCGRGLYVVVVVQLLVEGTLTATIDPMAILRAQLAFLKKRDQLPGAREDGEAEGTTQSLVSFGGSVSKVFSDSGTVTTARTNGSIVKQTTLHVSESSHNTSSNSLRSRPSPTSTPFYATTQKTAATAATKNSVLGSLFELGLNDVNGEDGVNDPIKSPTDNKAAIESINGLMRELSNMSFLPLVPKDAAGEANEANGNKSALLQYLDVLRSNAWGQFKSLTLSYTNWLEGEYQLQELADTVPLDLIKKVLDLGDRVNFLHVVGKKVDPGLAEFLANQLQPLFSHFEQLTAGRLVGGRLSSVMGDVVRDAAWKTMHQFVSHVLKVANKYVTRQDIENFQKDLAKTNPLAAQGLDVILNGPPKSTDSTKGRSYASRSGYGYGGYRDVGYGGYGSYDESYGSYGTVGHGGGYAAGMFLDPYLILAGLGAAVLLAYLAYRVIVTTGGGGGRSFNDLTFMDLSDAPTVVHSIYSLLEDAQDKYEASEDKGGVSENKNKALEEKDKTKSSEDSRQNDADDLIAAANSLWWQHESAKGCVRCSLFDYALNYALSGMQSGHDLAVAGLAQLLGSTRSGQLLDEVTSRVQDGRSVACQMEGNSCELRVT